MKNGGVAEMKNEECILPPTGLHYSSFFIGYAELKVLHSSFFTPPSCSHSLRFWTLLIENKTATIFYVFHL